MTPAPSLELCTVQGCDQPTQEYLCNDCTTELQHAWDQIGPLIPVLEDISRGDDVPFHMPTAEGRGGGGGSRPPMNLSAYQLALNLRQALVYTPQEYAQHSDGWRAHAQILQWVHNADRMVNGEKEEAKAKASIATYKVRDIHPMPVKHLLPWLNENAGVRITKQNIQDWVRRGKLQRCNDTGHPTYNPAEVLHAQAEDGRKK